MWCSRCQSEVAAEVSPDNQRVFCAVCSTLLSTIDPPPSRPLADRLGDRTKDARELLQRWSSGKSVDPFGPPMLTNRPSSNTESSSPQEARATTSNPSDVFDDSAARTSAALNDDVRPAVPVMSAFSPSDSFPPMIAPSLALEPMHASRTLSDPVAQAIPNLLATAAEPARPAGTPSSNPFVSSETTQPPATVSLLNPLAAIVPSGHFHRVDAAHPAVHLASGAKTSSTTPSPSIKPFASNDPPAATKRARAWFPTWDPAVWRSEPNATSGWSSLAGQFLAYAGVLGMTAGACMVVWSYFGGPANYAPTGWLLATAGQMLLFFGVVTLVSGGLEQTTEQVNKRIEQLGDHIIRIEQAAREISLRGGAVPPAHFGNDHNAPQRSASSDERSVVEQ